MRILTPCQISAILLLGFQLSCAAESFSPLTNGSTKDQHLVDETRQIHKHFLNRLNDQWSVEPEVLKQSCKYESDIATTPPKNKIVLTFDDGPEREQTEQILATLKKYSISATFFMIGKKAQTYPDLVQKVQAAGHQVIANHSWSHPNFHEIDVKTQQEEVKTSDILLASQLQPKLFRYPYGNSSCETNEYLHQAGYRIVGWHIDSCDWAFDKTGSVDSKEALTCGVLPQYVHDYVGHIISAARARHGGIILMHEIHPRTVNLLDEVIKQLIAEGFTFGTIAEEDFEPSLR